MLVLQSFLPYRLNCLASEMSMRTRAEYRRTYDMTMPEWRVLATLAGQGQQTAKAIGAQTYLHKTKVSRAVRSLEERRWISRIVNEKDMREELLSLSTAGTKAYDNVAGKLQMFQDKLLAELGCDQEEVLSALLRLEALVGIDHAASGASKVAMTAEPAASGVPVRPHA